MEDLSRELEDEIKAHERPERPKNKILSRIIVIDDVGTMKNADWMRTAIRVLTVVAVAAIVIACVLQYLYREANKGNAAMQDKFSAAEKKIVKLVREKEILMANLIMAGKLPKEFEVSAHGAETHEKPVQQVVDKEPPSKGSKADMASVEPTLDGYDGYPVRESQGEGNPAPEAVEDEGNSDVTEENTDLTDDERYQLDDTIRIEDFKLSANQGNGTLVVRFDVRKLSGKSVKGRAFVILKHDADNQDQWISIPGALLKEGKPSEPENGQYFSITNFKPMRFRLQSEVQPSFFKMATVMIYDGQGQRLIFEKDIKLDGNGS